MESVGGELGNRCRKRSHSACPHSTPLQLAGLLDSEDSPRSEYFTPTEIFFKVKLDGLTNNSREISRQHSSRNSPKRTQRVKPNFFQFICSELVRGYDLENAEERYTEKRKIVYAFMQIPVELEKFLFYGFLQCMDAFLYVFTFLPLRFLRASLCLLISPCRQKSLTSAEVCDMLRVFILIVASCLMTFVDTSVMYHLVRGQAVIKLYIFFNMLEVADKLFSSFGQDILDALFWTATEKRNGKREHLRTLAHLTMAIVYVVLHAMLVMFQATTLNVAFNSHNKALLTIMMSNNFVELKGSVFKKFAKNNLFQMSCSDVRERFHYCILLLIVVVRNMGEFSWKLEHFWEMVPDLALVLIGEFFVDWVKHAFITKFNDIPFAVYKDFTITIAYDVANARRSGAFSDHSDQVSRRMGFTPIPITLLLIRVIPQSIRMASVPAILLLCLGYLVLASFKVFNSIVLLGWAQDYIHTYEELQKNAEMLKRLQSSRKAKSLPGSPRLSLIEFSDILQQTHIQTKGFTFSDLHHLQHISTYPPHGSSRNEPPVQGEVTSNPGAPLKRTLPRSKSVAQIATPEKPKVDETFKDVSRVEEASGCQELAEVDRYTLCNDDRIES